MTSDERTALIRKYRDGYRVVQEALAGATAGELDAKPAPNKWSAREIVHHLADSEMTAGDPPAPLIAEDGPVIHGYDQDEFARRLYYDRPIETSLQALRASRRESTADLLDRLTAGRMDARGHAFRARAVQRRAVAEDLPDPRAQARRADSHRARGAVEGTVVTGPRCRSANKASASSSTAETSPAPAGTPHAALPGAHQLGAPASPLRALRGARPIRTGCRSAASCIRIRTAARATRNGRRRPRWNASISATPVSTGAERRAVRHVNLAAAACDFGVLVERRLEQRRPEMHARQAARIQSRGEWLRRRPTARHQLERLASCRGPRRRSCPRTARCPGRRPRSRASGCSATAAPRAARSSSKYIAARPALHRHDLELGADAELLVEEPRQLADRHAVPHRDRILADERLESRLEHRPFDRRRRRSDSGRSQTIDRQAVPCARRAGSWPSCRCRCRCACRRPADR